MDRFQAVTSFPLEKFQSLPFNESHIPLARIFGKGAGSHGTAVSFEALSGQRPGLRTLLHRCASGRTDENGGLGSKRG